MLARWLQRRWFAQRRLSPALWLLAPLAGAYAIAAGRGRQRAKAEHLPVPVTTLDELIARHGLPAFCKIDVEGYELEVLCGLSRPIPALSFEYLSVCLDRARACVARLAELGQYQFNWSVGESHRLRSDGWLDADRLLAHLGDLGAAGGSGDIYARLRAGAADA